MAHFSQAEGTPFTDKAFATLIETHQRELLSGRVPEAIREYAQQRTYHHSQERRIYQVAISIFETVQRTTTPLSPELSFDTVRDGFCKWAEDTTTSPSNRTLSHYKGLLDQSEDLLDTEWRGTIFNIKMYRM